VLISLFFSLLPTTFLLVQCAFALFLWPVSAIHPWYQVGEFFSGHRALFRFAADPCCIRTFLSPPTLSARRLAFRGSCTSPGLLVPQRFPESRIFWSPPFLFPVFWTHSGDPKLHLYSLFVTHFLCSASPSLFVSLFFFDLLFPWQTLPAPLVGAEVRSFFSFYLWKPVLKSSPPMLVFSNIFLLCCLAFSFSCLNKFSLIGGHSFLVCLLPVHVATSADRSLLLPLLRFDSSCSVSEKFLLWVGVRLALLGLLGGLPPPPGFLFFWMVLSRFGISCPQPPPPPPPPSVSPGKSLSPWFFGSIRCGLTFRPFFRPKICWEQSIRHTLAPLTPPSLSFDLRRRRGLPLNLGRNCSSIFSILAGSLLFARSGRFDFFPAQVFCLGTYLFSFKPV